MTTYYVRKSGNDANDGLTPATAWATINRALIGVLSGTWTAATSTTLTSSTTLTASALVGARVEILTSSGAGAGTYAVVTANTATSITVGSWIGSTPTGTGTFQVNCPVGGDVVYVGPGFYGQRVTISAPEAISEVQIIGDTLGVYTGDTPGYVLWTNWTGGINASNSSSNNSVLSINGRANLTFRYLWMYAYNSACVTLSTSSQAPQNIKFENCIMGSDATNAVEFTSGSVLNRSANITIQRCYIYVHNSSVNTMTFVFGGSAAGIGVADANDNILIRNCVLAGATTSTAIQVYGTSAVVYRRGGLTVENCTFVGNANMIGNNTGQGVSRTYPVVAKNCNTIHARGGLFSINTAYAYNDLYYDAGGNQTGAASNQVTTSPLSANTVPTVGMPIVGTTGYESLLQLPTRIPNTPLFGTTLQPAVDAGSDPLDMFGRSRQDAAFRILVRGTATSATSTTITDATKSWGTNELQGAMIRIISGTGAGQARIINTNTSSTITVTGSQQGPGNWATTPDATSQYIIYWGPAVLYGKSTAATSSTLTDSAAGFLGNGTARIVEIVAGPGSGQKRLIYSTTGTVLTIAGGRVQTLSFSLTSVTGGGFTLSFKGQRTLTQIPYNATAAQVQAALEGLSTIGAGNVICTGGPLPTSSVVITFQNALASNQADAIIGHRGFTTSNCEVNVTGTWETLPTASEYAVYPFANTNIAEPWYLPGALGVHDTGALNTSVSEDGTSLALTGMSSQEFTIPVSAKSTTLTIRARYDAYYGTSAKPQLVLVASAELGISEQTATMTGNADTWETLSLTFLPSRAGLVTVRLLAQSSTSYGTAYFDTFTVT